MIATDTSPRRFTPPWRAAERDIYFYLIRAGGITERAQIEAELAGEHRAGRVFPFELLAALRNGLSTLMAEDLELGRLLDIVNQDAAGEPLAPADVEALKQVRALLAQHWPDYRDLVAQEARRREILPVVTFRRLCAGWQGPKVAFAKGIDEQVTEAALLAIDPLELMIAGRTAYQMLYGGGHERDFPQRSPSDDSPRRSRSAARSAKAGKSMVSAGKKTRGSRSRPGSGASSTSG